MAARKIRLRALLLGRIPAVCKGLREGTFYGLNWEIKKELQRKNKHKTGVKRDSERAQKKKELNEDIKEKKNV